MASTKFLLLARKLFADSALLTEPACALVYAAPVEFYHRLTAVMGENLFDEYRMLPNPAVHQRPLTGDNWKLSREPNKGSLGVMREVVAKRLETQSKAVDEIIDHLTHHSKTAFVRFATQLPVV